MKFSELNLSGDLQAAIDKSGFADCTPIQEQAIPALIEGKDVAGLAQTGTGKTAAFLIPLMERVLRSQPQHGELPEDVKALAEARGFKDWRAQNFILILVPTRELAEQVQEQTLKFGEVSGLRGTAIYGGTSYDKQKDALKRGVQFIAATPGRLIDLYKEHLVDLKQVRAIVFDEADRMFDMGFKDDMKYILQRVPGDRQFCVFSATLNFDVLNTAYQFGANPVEFNVSRDQAKAENVKDQIFHLAQEEKGSYMVSLMKLHSPKQAIVFTNFKHNVDRIAKFLTDNGMPAMGISSLLTQAQRTRVMEMFKAENDKNILVATDVAARGLDIQGVDLVVNYELPMDPESYVHRIGRTGRAGQTGNAYSLVSDRDVDSLMRIEEYLKHKLETGFLEDKDIVKDVSQFPSGDFSPGRMLNDSFREGGGGRGGGGRGGDRGPRRDGGGRGGDRGGRGGDRGRGPRRDGDRGPRRDGDRGPRRDGEHRAHGNGADREHMNGNGAHPEANGEHRPRHEGGGRGGERGRGPRRDGDRGPRRDGDRGPRREGQHGDRGPRREGQHGDRGPRQARGSGGPKGFKPPPKKQNAGVGGKVKSFIKKLFGQ